MATLNEVAERFALDNLFTEYPTGATVADLQDVAENVESFFDDENWLFSEGNEDLAYVSASAILQAVYDRVWEFKRYYREVSV